MNLSMLLDDKEIINTINSIKKSIKEEVLLKGLDQVLSKDLEELKKKMLYYINEQTRFVNKTQNKDTIDEPTINIPKSDKDWLKELLEVDLENKNVTTDFTKYFEHKLLVVKDNRLRLHIPETPDGTIEQSYSRALEFFKDAVVVNIINNRVSYHVIDNFNPNSYVKIVCSKDTGITSGSTNRFENEKKSKANRFNDSSIGKFSTWTMKQDGVKEMLKESTNLTSVIESLKSGDFEEAKNLLRGKNVNNSKKMKELEEKVDKVEKRQGTSPDLNSYQNIIKLINNIKFSKKLLKESTTYELITTDFDESLEKNNILEVLQKESGIWLATNQEKWLAKLSEIIKQSIEKLVRG